jgi:hypothetical protein
VFYILCVENGHSNKNCGIHPIIFIFVLSHQQSCVGWLFLDGQSEYLHKKLVKIQLDLHGKIPALEFTKPLNML